MPDKTKDDQTQAPATGEAPTNPATPAPEPAPENKPVPQSPPSIDGTQPVLQPQQPLDQTVPGGIYVVDGRAVDANGQPVKGYVVVDGKAVKE